jgi:hypothetical protein
MTDIQNTCEGQPSGTALTTGNSAGGGDALANVTGTWQFSSTGVAHGSTGWRCVQGAAAAWRCYWSYTGNTLVSVRGYFTLNASTGGAARDFGGLVNSSFGTDMRWGIDGTNHLQVKNAAGTIVFTATSPITVGTTYRIEALVNTGTTTGDGKIYFKYFIGDNTTEEQSYVGDNVNAGAGNTVIRTQLGNNDSVTIDVTFDDWLTRTGSFAFLGPYNTGATITAPLAAAQSSSPVATVTATEVIDIAPPPSNSSALVGTVSAGVTVTAPVAGASSSAPVGSVGSAVTITAPVAGSSSSAPTGTLSVGITTAAPLATAASTFPLPNISAGVTVSGDIAVATATALDADITATDTSEGIDITVSVGPTHLRNPVNVAATTVGDVSVDATRVGSEGGIGATRSYWTFGPTRIERNQ